MVNCFSVPMKKGKRNKNCIKPDQENKTNFHGKIKII